MHCIIRHWADKLVRQLVNHLPFGISFHDIPIADLPAAFQGFTIVQISDLHVDRWNRPVVEAAIHTVNAMNADLVVFTGDAIANGKRYLGDITYLLGQMEGRTGKVACLGNHDYSDWSGSHGVRRALNEAGFEVLVNDSTLLTRNHQQIQLAGADDLILGRQCLKTIARRLSHDVPTVLLSHNPENFDAMAAFEPDLVLSGHTHGGQIRMPAPWHHKLLGSPYVSGMYKKSDSRLYVNRGLGSAVFIHHIGERRISLPTPRWAVEPEVSVFRLFNPQAHTHVERLAS